jgi:hypothetical protein
VLEKERLEREKQEREIQRICEVGHGRRSNGPLLVGE